MRPILTLLVFAFAVHSLRAEDAGQFRGPGGTGVSGETNLPTRWSDTENLRWKASLPGRGLSNPVIAGGRVFVTAASRPNQNRLHVLCFDAKDGKQIWERQFLATGHTQCHIKTNMAAPTPVTDGQFVYALFATADLVCLDRDGNLAWARSLTGDYPTIGNNVGMASSPILVGDVLVVHMENTGESFAVGIDKGTGVNRWRFDRPRVINWNTPFALTEKGERQVLLMTPKEVTAHDPATGKQLWATSGHWATNASISGGGGLVLVPGDKLTAFKAGTDEVVWQNSKLNVGYCSPLVYQDRVFTITNNGVVSCAEIATGKVTWTHRLDGKFAASPLAAAGRLYFTSEEGSTYVMHAGGEAKEIATNKIADTFLASPVASGGAIFLRSDSRLYCIGTP